MAVDPSGLHRKLTSGDAGSIASLAHAVGDVRSTLTGAADAIATGIDTVSAGWQGTASAEFLARTTKDARAIGRTFQGLDDAQRAVQLAARSYRVLAHTADAAYRPWGDLSPAERAKRPDLAAAIVRRLMRAGHTYEGRLRACRAALRAGGTGDRSDLTHVGAGTPWVPQGLAYLGPGRDQFLVASYHDGSEKDGQPVQSDDDINPDAKSRLAVVNNSDGAETQHVELGGKRAEGPAGQPLEGAPPNHVGGVAAHGDHVWVTSTHGSPPHQRSQVYVYSQRDIDNAKPGAAVHPTQVIDTPASSYVNYSDGKLWIGQYRTNGNADDEGTEPKLYGYDVDSTGGIGTGGPAEEYTTPRYVQGAVVRDGEIVYSKSGDNPGLYTYDRDAQPDPDGGNARDYHEDTHKVEEIEEVDGEIVTLHEGGADEYLSWLQRALGIGGGDLTRTPLDELGLDGAGSGFGTDADALQSGAGSFTRAGTLVGDAADRVGNLQLVAHVLGDVPAAPGFATAVTAFLAARGDTLRAGEKAMDDTADGLAGNAEAYRRQEHATSNGLARFGLGLG